MPNKFLFADEAGCFTFTKQHNVSRYFILCSVAMDDNTVASSLLSLRRQLAWDGAEIGDYFHATRDKQAVRDAVFDTIMKHDFTVQLTIMEKTKAQPQITKSKSRFYQHAWYYHFKFGTQKLFTDQHEALITAASLGDKKERLAFHAAIEDVMRQTMRVKKWKTDFMPCSNDPCLQVADYCAWAAQRKWESGGKDCRSYNLIKDRITYEFDLWEKGDEHHY